ncbi:MAG: MFS transporter, partial [Hyphomonadaceae bacterium]
IFAGEVSGMRATTAAAAFNGALALGSLIAQYPAGWLSDRTDRRNVILGLAAFGCAVSLALSVSHALPWSATLVLAGLWGAGSMSFYGVAVAHAADRAAPGQTTGMMAGILVTWAVGALVGPLIAGAMMTAGYGARALFLYAALGLACLAAAVAVRRARAAAPAPEEKSPFTVSPATSTAAAAIDPRTDDLAEQPDLFTAQPEERS